MARYIEESARNLQYLFAITSLAGAFVMMAPAGLAEAHVELGLTGTIYAALGGFSVLFAAPAVWVALARKQWFFVGEFKRARRRLYLGFLYGVAFGLAYVGYVGPVQLALAVATWLGSTGAGLALFTYSEFYHLQDVRGRISSIEFPVATAMCERCLSVMPADEEECCRCGYRFDRVQWNKRILHMALEPSA
jgi:hypothetical protein